MECGEEKRREFEIPCGILHSMDYVSPGFSIIKVFFQEKGKKN